MSVFGRFQKAALVILGAVGMEGIAAAQTPIDKAPTSNPREVIMTIRTGAKAAFGRTDKIDLWLDNPTAANTVLSLAVKTNSFYGFKPDGSITAIDPSGDTPTISYRGDPATTSIKESISADRFELEPYILVDQSDGGDVIGLLTKTVNAHNLASVHSSDNQFVDQSWWGIVRLALDPVYMENSVFVWGIGTKSGTIVGPFNGNQAPNFGFQPTRLFDRFSENEVARARTLLKQPGTPDLGSMNPADRQLMEQITEHVKNAQVEFQMQNARNQQGQVRSTVPEQRFQHQ